MGFNEVSHWYSILTPVFHTGDLCLLPEAEARYQLPIATHVVLAEVSQEATPLPHELQEPSSGVVVMGIRLQVVSQLTYAAGEQRDLNLG
jgi:hypothetical protein